MAVKIMSADTDVRKVLLKMGAGTIRCFWAKKPNERESIRNKVAYLHSKGEGRWSIESQVDYVKITRVS